MSKGLTKMSIAQQEPPCVGIYPGRGYWRWPNIFSLNVDKESWN